MRKAGDRLEMRAIEGLILVFRKNGSRVAYLDSGVAYCEVTDSSRVDLSPKTLEDGR